MVFLPMIGGIMEMHPASKLSYLIIFNLFCLFSLQGSFAWSSTYPLDDLSPEEIAKTVKTIKESHKFADDLRFPILKTKEPLKAEILSYLLTGKTPVRKAFASIFEKAKNRLTEVTVDLNQNKISEIKLIPGQQPPLLLEEYDRINEIIKTHPQWRAGLEKRGIDPKDVWLDGWALGLESAKEQKSGKRLIRGVPYLKKNIKNFYSRPIEGLLATIDMNTETVYEVIDLGKAPVARGQELTQKTESKRGLPLKKLVVSQPDGPSFKITGQQIEWSNWIFHYSISPMEGLMIHQLTYRDDDRDRTVLYKGSLAEMLVPYGEPGKIWSFRNAFDVGQYGIGRTAHNLVPGVDAPENAVFLDAYFADDKGEVMSVPRAVAIYERDSGIQWEHFDQFLKETAAMRGRQLVTTFTTTVGNYDYGINWILHQDGVIEVEVHLTGIMLAKGTDLKTNPCRQKCEHLAEPLIITPNHQHFFSFRLDVDIDGVNNSIYELNTKALPVGPKNPDRNAFEMFPTLIDNEANSCRDLNMATSRKWKISNMSFENKLKHPVSYVLMAGENSIPYLSPQSPIRKQAFFINHPVWFTRYHDDEQHPAGDYPNQNHAGDGLKKFQANHENLKNQDIVLWYNFGITHHTRPEEWPVMNAHRAGFKLMPMNFFSRNPTTQ